MAALMPIFFKLLNMAVTFAFITYMGKKYIMPSLNHGFKHDQEELTHKQTSMHELQQANQQSIKVLADESHTVQRLKLSIEQWQSRMRDQTLMQQEEQSVVQKNIVDAVQQMLIASELKKQHAKVMALALEGAQRSLQHHFAHNEGAAHAYNETILNHIEKS